MHPHRLIAACGLVVACASNSPAPTDHEHAGWRLESTQAVHPDDAVVARVGDHPVYASCVQVQAKAHGLNKEEALQECIDFELLAIAAQDAGTLVDSDVQTAGKQELVRVFVKKRYEIQGPDDIPDPIIERLWDQIKVPRYNHPELRNIVFCRIALTAEQGPKSAEYQTAEAFLTQIYEKLRDRRDLEKNDLFAPCYEEYEAAGVHDLKLHTFGLSPESRFQEAFRKPIFGAESKGMVVPPLHTQYGWDLILVTQVVPEKTTPLAKAEPELRKAFFELPVYDSDREALFSKWYAPFARARNIEVHPERLPTDAPVTAGVQP